MQEIVIKIPWKVADAFINDRANHMQNKALRDALREGKVLPKGHGRLIDADTLADGFEDNYEFCEALNATPTLVEADEGDKQ